MICTFYSFKGGVGRSMALANIAELLYRRGLNVLMVDFDLEAPGLERFFDVPDAINKPVEIQEKRGIIDLLISYKELCSLPPEVNFTPSFSVEPIANFITPIYEAGDGKGRLSIIQAGCCRSEKHLAEYAKKIRFFDWNDFYSNLDGGHFFNWFREELEKAADIVLVDSRTGFAEISGICAYQLADLVILFVAANEQNFDGTKMMAHSLRNDKLIQEGRQGRPLDLLFVPSRVERAESDRLDKFKEDFEKCFGEFFDPKLKFEQGIFLDLGIPYVPKYAYTEQVATRDFNNPSKQASSLDLNDAYNNLMGIIEQLASRSHHVQAAYSLAKNNQLQDAVMTLEQDLTPYTFEDIQKAAKEVPLVYIMMTELGGLALIVHNMTITQVWLDKLIQNFDDEKIEETTSWLWQSIMKPLMTKIYPHSKVMLIAMGELSRLPFHAAWIEDKTAITGKRYALDILTIAYVPNARTLIEAKKITKRVYADSLSVQVPETIRQFWDVSDDISMMIMIRFYDLWRKSGLEPVEALRQAQLWMRDSTNGEKLVYFKQLYFNKRIDKATLKQIRRTIGFVKMENRYFAHPFHWASFNYVGV